MGLLEFAATRMGRGIIAGDEASRFYENFSWKSLNFLSLFFYYGNLILFFSFLRDKGEI